MTHILLERLSSRRQEIVSIGEDVVKRELLCAVGGNVNWCRHYGRQYGGSSKKKRKRKRNRNYHMTRQFHSWVCAREMQTGQGRRPAPPCSRQRDSQQPRHSIDQGVCQWINGERRETTHHAGGSATRKNILPFVKPWTP